MNEKRRVVRRRPAPKAPAAARESCGCGEVSVTFEGDLAVVRGKGWQKEYQWVVCSSCRDQVRYSPQIAWETSAGERFTTKGYLGGSGERKLA